MKVKSVISLIVCSLIIFSNISVFAADNKNKSPSSSATTSSSKPSSTTSSSWGSSKTSTPASDKSPDKLSDTATTSKTSWGSASKSDPVTATKADSSSVKASTDSSKGSTPATSTGNSWGSKSTSTTDVIKKTPSGRAVAVSNMQEAREYNKRNTETAKLLSTKSPEAIQSEKDQVIRRIGYTSPSITYTSVDPYTPERRIVVVNTYHNVYGGRAFADPYDHMIIWGLSDLWWYNHWHSIDRSHYYEDARYRELEARIHQMEAQNISRNSNYIDPNIPHESTLSAGYIDAVKNGSIENVSEDSFGGVMWIVVVFLLISVCILGYMVLQGKKKR